MVSYPKYDCVPIEIPTHHMYTQIFIADHSFLYSILNSVFGFFTTTLLKPFSESKSPALWYH